MVEGNDKKKYMEFGLIMIESVERTVSLIPENDN